MELRDLGWDDGFSHQFEPWAAKPDVRPGRVFIAFNYICRVYVEGSELEAVVSGRLKHHASSRSELPAVGDWVAVRKRPAGERGVIVGVLPRRSRFSRKVAGNVTDEQIVAANVNVVFVVMGLDQDFSLRRLERYLLLARESGAAPAVLLTKPDLCQDIPARVADVAALAGDAPVHVLSPRFNQGLEQVDHYLTPGRTGALLGSSGVGKTTIINRLVGTDARKTRELRESDSTGQHTTSHRELVVLPNGGLLIDTPGMRELQPWDAGAGVAAAFADVAEIAARCKFRDCSHTVEPGCAVTAALADGSLDLARWQSFLRMSRATAHEVRRVDKRAALETKSQFKKLTKALRQRVKEKHGYE